MTVKRLMRRLARLMPAPLGPVVTLIFKDGTSRQVSFLEANDLIARDRNIVDAVTDHKSCTEYLRVLIESWVDAGNFEGLWKDDETGGGADDRGEVGEVNSGAALPASVASLPDTEGQGENYDPGGVPPDRQQLYPRCDG